jgi:atypical dual specificity phosphatase
MGYNVVLENLSVRFGDRVVLDGVDLKLPERGVVAMMGPGGVGKSTLLRTMSGMLFDVAYASVDGKLLFRDAPIDDEHHPSIVLQKLHLARASVLEHFAAHLPNRTDYTRDEQRTLISGQLDELGLSHLSEKFDEPVTALDSVDHRLVSIAGETFSDPPVLCVDEPTAALEDEDAEQILALLEKLGLERTIVFVTHNQRHARQIADYAALLAGGNIVEYTTSDQFFEAPQHEATQQYVRTGGCSIPSPNASAEELDPAFTPLSEASELEETTEPDPPISRQLDDVPYDESRRPTPRKRRSGSSYAGPRGFHWLEPDELGGCPRPGIVNDIKYDLDALERVGVTHLVTLTESKLDPEVFEDTTLKSLFFPVVDMEAPTMDAAFEMCDRVDALLADGNVIAYHCKAGLGRTGTMLAAQLVWWGASSEDAVEQARSVQPKWIQSDAQIRFLEQLEQAVEDKYGS